jgi:hypothetical protein
MEDCLGTCKQVLCLIDRFTKISVMEDCLGTCEKVFYVNLIDLQNPQRWKTVLGQVDKFYQQHRWIYIDAHILFTLYRNGQKERASEMLEKLKTYVK